LEIRLFDKLDSTQRYLTEALNFFASVALEISDLPSDLPLSSASIYFSFVMKKILAAHHAGIWLKWPNDFYIGEQKVGGTITQKVGENLVCGMGINLQKAPKGYGAVALDLSPEILLQQYLDALGKFPEWKQIFSEYRVEFELSRAFSVHIGNSRKSLSNALLCEDGSLLIEGKKVFSTR